jgi:hypothetical protein
VCVGGGNRGVMWLTCIQDKERTRFKIVTSAALIVKGCRCVNGYVCESLC